MPLDSLEKFRQKVLEDATLQESLRDIPEREAFVRLTVQLGAEHGYSFTAAEVEAALQAERRAWAEGRREA